jgi:hypothetical protein
MHLVALLDVPTIGVIGRPPSASPVIALGFGRSAVVAILNANVAAAVPGLAVILRWARRRARPEPVCCRGGKTRPTRWADNCEASIEEASAADGTSLPPLAMAEIP